MQSMQRLASFLILSSLPLTACAEELPDADWRQPDPENLLYMQLQSGTVVMELAPAFAPNTIANIKTLVREKYFDGLAVIRSHDNYVAQWGDPEDDVADAKPIGSAAETVEPEFQRPLKGIALTRIDSRNAYAIEHLSSLPRGANGPLQFYASEEQTAPIRSVRLGSDISPDDRMIIAVMRTESDAFASYVRSRTFRSEDFFVEPTGRIEICNLQAQIRVLE